MSKLFSLLSGLIVLVSASAYADGEPLPNLPELVTFPPEYVFVPQGFDNNDVTQVTISGSLPNTCFRTGPTSAIVDHATQTITIQHRAYYYSSCWCLPIFVPFSQTVDVGVLPAGNYKVAVEHFNGSLVQKSQMPVGFSMNAGPDDHLYAMVDQLQIEPVGDGSTKKLTVTGLLAGSCMRLKGIELKYRDNNVIEVLPLVEVNDEKSCSPAKTKFKRSIVLTPKWKGQALIHVRSLNGKAMNQLTEF